MTTRLLVAVAAALTAFAGVPTDATAQAGLMIRGHFSWGAEVSALRPCGTDVVYWLSAPDEISSTLAQRSLELQSEAYEEVYVEVAGWAGTGPRDGFASHFAASWTVTRVDEVRAATESDCTGSTPPIWLDPDRVDCDSPTTRDVIRCITLRLVEADVRLADYTTEALDYAADSDGLYRAQQAWERYRDLQCTAAAEQFSGGSLQPVRLLGCRLDLSEARLLTVWDEYLVEAGTDLPDPRTGGIGEA